MTHTDSITDAIRTSRDAITLGWPAITRLVPELTDAIYLPVEGRPNAILEDLDMRHHIDAIAVTHRGLWLTLSTRHQPVYNYPTVTFRPAERNYLIDLTNQIIPRYHIQLYGTPTDPDRLIVADLHPLRRRRLADPNLRLIRAAQQDFYAITADELLADDALVKHYERPTPLPPARHPEPSELNLDGQLELGL